MRFRIVLVFLMLFAGCAVGPDPNLTRLATLPGHYRHFDMDMAWDVTDNPSGAVVTGVIKNVRYTYMDNVEVWVAIVDREGKARGPSVGFVVPIQLELDQAAPFTVRLHDHAPPGTKLRFTYIYQASEGGASNGAGFRWMQSFDALVPPV
ncbi:hypothetical protein [Geomesophilobacter sediminis]|uniref:Lipoprotein n=1 Tax=Geomesophilobacter sediminis TaxID=2798584 RepID=A0A8J7S9A5_9BACT|nr:hypothetical protein [Geomesophilobacter sediminis]MBJ6726831.1 hypothetical protein [Geomesophilobacter sediminis]